MPRPNRIASHLQVHQFNLRYHRGDRVLYRISPTAPPVEDTVFCEAEVIHGHVPVAWLAGRQHPVPLSTIQPLPEATPHAN